MVTPNPAYPMAAQLEYRLLFLMACAAVMIDALQYLR
jgi:hypothetical protein